MSFQSRMRVYYLWWEKVLEINRSAKGLSIVTRVVTTIVNMVLV